jgi:hypothetical protein
MRYKEMLEKAKSKGLTSEALMWESIEELEEMLCELKERNPHKYWKFMRKQHGMLHKNHYDEEFALWDVKHIKYKDKSGELHEGAYWSMEQIKDATKGMAFPPEVTDWDKYVAFNSMKADLAKSFDDGDILKAAYDFYFRDDDAPQGKIWLYMCKMLNSK